MMLAKFSVKNYRGFSKRIEWDLSTPNNYEFNTEIIRNGVIKNGIIYGPNGSGKTNFGLALFDIVNHLAQRWKKPDYYANFIYVGNMNAPVEFEYTFKDADRTINYCYSKNSIGQLLTEKLTVDDQKIFERTNRKFDIDTDEFPMENVTKRNLKDNANFVSIINFLLTSYPLAKNHYLIALLQFVNSMLWFRCLDTREFIGLDLAPTNLDEYFIQNNLVEDFSEFLKQVSGQEYQFVKPRPNDKLLVCKIGGKDVLFDPIISTGTNALMLLYFWIQKMKSASFVFIDEFDAFYHFKLAFEVCKRLFALDCQVFTSSHNTYLMTNDLLRPDCNFIVNNNMIKPLSACTKKELRFGHNIEKLFRGNAFCV
ncbi:ATP/GTP-binding protein [uncultured Alistipes sp.]|uniref:AAA family ATPase n=1 Tax=uncultured Alistipes sp. TaxID=538949 RepID=UPI00351CE660